MTETSAPVSNWNAPNIITVARMIATPFFVWMLLADHGENGPLRWAAAAFFVIAIATDAWDGYLARSRGLVTDLGKLLDPIADKLLTGAALVGLSILGELPWWITIVVLIREVGITVHRLMIVSDVVVAAAWMGKLKTVAQSVAITLALLPLADVLGAAAPIAIWANIITMTIAVVLTILSGIDYVLAYVRNRSGGGARA
ncbi:CDP-diacylglycerol--glycerol-3-phosphate 3-phosphatidyltransferase [Leucobacter luti]|uniref:CDP-diacylglycerol--glycerol-3-phosphate 3-phosphatidyltransferase n=1 Tax=Leucobacter luti TaxID=340320 RepID=A0A4Q7TTZ0_9MICO|nr:CDP-diacylglycerol--glycerol-3-phosphate 3-phosphatidyltransferase [Leucobacter luti]MBL3698475.1 CDP-diacylglycerol--glycerol-3-phosphate 3-phosphatidyltransferase [Leucobacter luti]RZT64436.1 CDP-diacylglycerol--glycerol-3-phosphate 3-phosphatidyltransferase [Leucobacter luti]